MNEKDRKVVPSMELLSEMETLQIYGGVEQIQNDPDGWKFICINGNCDEANCSNCSTNCSNCGVYCSNCDCTVIQPKTGTDDCTVVKAVNCGS